MAEAGARVPALIGSAAAIVVLLAMVAWTGSLRVAQREWVFDRQLELSIGWRKPQADTPIFIIDIDRDSLVVVGPWPWRRDLLANLARTALDRGAQSVAFDILFAGPDVRSPGATARRIAREEGNTRLAEIAKDLPDSDTMLEETIQDQPVAIGFTFDPTGPPLQVKAPLLRRGDASVAELWSSPGAVPPNLALLTAAQGLGLLSLPGDPDGVVRHVPLLVQVAGVMHPGLAAEALRLSQGASGYILSSPRNLSIGDVQIVLPSGGLLRLSPRLPATTSNIIPAHHMLTGKADTGKLKDAIVLIGASAPEIGGLRNSLLDPLTPSVALHAHALRQIMAGISPVRPTQAPIIELLLAVAVSTAGIIAALTLGPSRGATILILIIIVAAFATIALAAWDTLIDPSLSLLAGTVAFLTASLSTYALTRKREMALRRRFEQHLAPGVVARIAENPNAVRLNGERRQITALFTDIDGFAALTAASAAEELIEVLDGYFEGVATIIIRHGGMIDKFVGDAVHAFFNMPLDLADHADKAIVCAGEIVCWTEDYRRAGLAQRIGLGRTRIGVETGEAVVGDVGLSTKLDYTAYGNAVNIAARLETLNKQMGTSICVGPGAAGASKERLRSLGVAVVPGVGALELFTPEDREHAVIHPH